MILVRFAATLRHRLRTIWVIPLGLVCEITDADIDERWNALPSAHAARQADGSQLPVAAIALRDAGEFHMSAADLKDELNATLAAEERLDRIEIMDWNEFPIGITGKTLKREFRRRAELI